MLNLVSAGALAFALASAFWISSSPSQANPVQPKPEAAGLSAGHVLMCDTANEVEAVLTAGEKDLSARLLKVNARFGKESCNVVTAAFYKGDEAKVVLVPIGVVRIVMVDIVGVREGETWLRITRPAHQYVGILEKTTMV